MLKEVEAEVGKGGKAKAEGWSHVHEFVIRLS